MQEQDNIRRIPVGVVAGLTAALLAAGGGGAWWAWNSLNSSTAPPSAPTASPSPPATSQVTETTAQIYWLSDSGNEIQVVPSTITLEETSDQPSEILEVAVKRLLAGPVNPANTTTIPQGTQLRSLTVESDGVHVDLSEEFTTGGGSASMTGRLAQVLYTATSLDPATKVWFDVEGQPLEVLGGEGLVIDQPMTRKNFEENFQL
jgi:spore germination protein GerM